MSLSTPKPTRSSSFEPLMREVSVVMTLYNAMPYLELFWKSAKLFLAPDLPRLHFVLLEMGSTDGTTEYVHSSVASVADVCVVSRSGLSATDGAFLDQVLAANDMVCGEGLWDFLLYTDRITTRYCIGFHVDIAFRSPGLVDYLVRKISAESSLAVVSPIYPGQFDQDDQVFSMPGFHPYVACMNVPNLRRLGLRWSKCSPGLEMWASTGCQLASSGDTHLQTDIAMLHQLVQRYQVNFDNGSLMLLQALRREAASAPSCRAVPQRTLRTYVRHYGCLWATNHPGYDGRYAERSKRNATLVRHVLSRMPT